MLTDKQSFSIKRVVRKCYPFFVLTVFVFSPLSIAVENPSAEIQEVRIIAESGAVSLALQSIDEQQKNIDIKENKTGWLEWERERLNIYQVGQRWQALQKRVATYGKGFPDNFYYWAKQQQIDALLTLKHGQQARFILQNLIWSKKSTSEKETRIHNQWLPLWQKE